eukprot:TRINITY_DN2819_c0_g1_i1.p1 TRINITY_DN2819_c0_g1~~TRINITY_DN2819_c0_g1_i1.p1  ORF type:complete len:604 (+),score=186.99 TRINITY_DN2819_c0_g1_i1:236-1813(+)
MNQMAPSSDPQQPLKPQRQSIFARMNIGSRAILAKREEIASNIIPTAFDIQYYLETYILIVGLYSIWILINVGLFAVGASNYSGSGTTVMIARGFGMTLNFNCALILVPVLRNILTALRKTFLHSFIPWDFNIEFHKSIGWAIVVAGTIHGLAHFRNYHAMVPQFGDEYKQMFTTLGGFTGFFISMIMVLIVTTAVHEMRRNHFNLFYVVHHTMVIFFVLMLFHGPHFWAWLLIPAILYIVERLLREYRGKQTAMVLRVKTHPSDVIEIHIKKNKFKYSAGQYVYLNCPSISPYEWHPFTITSAPEQGYTSVHIRCVGPFTKALKALLAPNETEGFVSVNKSRSESGKQLVRLDGPFGAASEEVFHFKTAVLIGAGIGVTPFASILKSMLLKLKSHTNLNLTKVYFYWICRDYTAFEWFRSLLQEIEAAMEKRGYFVEINIYLTGKRPESENPNAGLDPFTQLNAITNFGRPDFNEIFTAIAQRHSTRVGVFFCGPYELGKSIKSVSSKVSRKAKTTFVFHKENF